MNATWDKYGSYLSLFSVARITQTVLYSNGPLSEACSYLQTIDNFLTRAKEALSVRPQSVEEIGEVNQAHARLTKEQPEIQPLFLEAEQKNKLLRSVAGGGVEELQSLKTRWDKFEIMMESHQLMIKDQVGLGQRQGLGLGAFIFMFF